MLKKSDISKHLASKAFVAGVLLATATAATAQEPAAPMTISAQSDSTYLVMGDRTTVNVEVVKNGHEGALIGIPKPQTDYYGMELVDFITDSVDLGNGRVQLNYHFTFQAFDPADILTLPGFRYAQGPDTVTSDIITFKVLPVELSPELGDINDIDSLTIHPDEQVSEIGLKWYDYIPSWIVWVILALALIALAVTLYTLYKKNGPKLFVPRKPIPPYELAMDKLRKLKDKRLIDKGLAKQFYTEVTDIWRSYLEGRFGISAMEMTSRQILKELRKNQQTHLSAKEMESMLEISDFVKFAALSPSREDMLGTYNTILQFVESTKPEPDPEAEGKAAPDKTKQKPNPTSKK